MLSRMLNLLLELLVLGKSMQRSTMFGLNIFFESSSNSEISSSPRHTQKRFLAHCF